MWTGWLKLLVYLGVTEFGVLESNMLIGKYILFSFTSNRETKKHINRRTNYHKTYILYKKNILNIYTRARI